MRPNIKERLGYTKIDTYKKPFNIYINGKEAQKITASSRLRRGRKLSREKGGQEVVGFLMQVRQRLPLCGCRVYPHQYQAS
jgi:hypothetical protein